MYSKNFSSKDIRNNKKIKALLESFFIEQYHSIYRNIKEFNQPIGNQLSKEIAADLNRQLNLFIQDKSSNTNNVNVVDNMHKTIKESPLFSSHLCTYLQETYQL